MHFIFFLKAYSKANETPICIISKSIQLQLFKRFNLILFLIQKCFHFCSREAIKWFLNIFRRRIAYGVRPNFASGAAEARATHKIGFRELQK